MKGALGKEDSPDFLALQVKNQLLPEHQEERAGKIMQNLDNSLRITLFGTSSGLPSVDRDNTSLGILDRRDAVLIDSSASPFRKLLQSGIDPQRVRGVILTHRHIDHCYGIPSLIHSLHLFGRRLPLKLWAAPEADLLIRAMMRMVQGQRARFPFPLHLHLIPARRRHTLIRCKGFHVESCPVDHGPPTLPVRATSSFSGKRIVYSSDTAPCDSLARFARGADLLVMEANFLRMPRGRKRQSHSTAREAGERRQRCGVKRLVLVHLRAGDRAEEYCREARKTFQGPVAAGKDLLTLRP